MNENSENNGAESSRESSVYPYTSLEPSLRIADAVKECGGARSTVSKSRLAAQLGESEKSASFQQRISSAKAFGLIVGRSEYGLSEAAKQYYSPTTEQGRSNALLEFLTAPSSFREIIRLFDGELLPKREILANIFSEKLKVPESWKVRAAGFFENSAQFVGVIDEDRFLRFKAAQHASVLNPIRATATEPGTTAAARNPTHTGKSTEAFSDQEIHSLFLDKDKTRTFTINSPLFISRADYDRICKWIEVTLIIEDSEAKKEP